MKKRHGMVSKTRVYQSEAALARTIKRTRRTFWIFLIWDLALTGALISLILEKLS